MSTATENGITFEESELRDAIQVLIDLNLPPQAPLGNFFLSKF